MKIDLNIPRIARAPDLKIAGTIESVFLEPKRQDKSTKATFNLYNGISLVMIALKIIKYQYFYPLVNNSLSMVVGLLTESP